MSALPSQTMLKPQGQPTSYIEAATAVGENISPKATAQHGATLQNGATVQHSDKQLEYIAEATDVGFNPVMTDHGLNGGKDSKLKSMMGFNITPYGSYYNMLRTMQYLFQALTPMGIIAVGGGFLHKNSASEDLSKNNDALNLFYKIEAGLITSVAMLRTSIECQHMLDDFRLSLAAEFGKDREDVNIMDALQSKNPIIDIETNRMLWKFGSRFISGAGFAFGLTTGLVCSAIDIGAERTLFFANTPYDMLSKTVNDVQFNHLEGDVIKEILVKDLQKVLQAMYSDRGRNVLVQQEMEDLRPTLAKIAQDIIDKRIGIESIFGIMGGGIVVVGDAKQSEINYDFVSKNMMESVVEITKAVKARAISANNIVDFQRREGGQTILPHDIAATARPDFVQAERERLQAKDFSNMGMPSR